MVEMNLVEIDLVEIKLNLVDMNLVEIDLVEMDHSRPTWATRDTNQHIEAVQARRLSRDPDHGEPYGPPGRGL